MTTCTKPRSLRVVLAALLVVAIQATGACSNSSNSPGAKQADKEQTSAQQGDSQKSDDAKGDSAKGDTAKKGQGSATLDTQEAMNRATQAVASAFGSEASDVKAKELTHIKVPGLALFRMTYDAAGRYINVVVTPDAVHIKPPGSIAAVIKAWGYGEKRTVSAKEFAKAVGILETQYEVGNVLSEQYNIDDVKKAWRQHLFLPREAEVDGKPAVEYWMEAGEPPLWQSTIIIDKDGSFEHKTQEIWDF